MNRTQTNTAELFAQVLNPVNRANPYPIYAELRQTPVSLQKDGTYVVSTYNEIMGLLNDPRISCDGRKSTKSAEIRTTSTSGAHLSRHQEKEPAFIVLDSPEHDRLRRLVMHQFTPERIRGMEKEVLQIINELLDAKQGQQQIDIVDELAYPLPVTIICKLLGVPREDEPRFRIWATALALSLDTEQGMSEEDIQNANQATVQMREYIMNLIAIRRAKPETDLLSALVSGDDPAGRMNDEEISATMGLLLIAGHETTVNLITNSMLTLLRHPNIWQRLRSNPRLSIPIIEEVQRYDPPVQFRPRTAHTDLACAGINIPKGASLMFLLASGSRDPKRFTNADQFIPERADNEHLGFGAGVHYCVGAPLARIETQDALETLARRLINPSLAVDPPPYRENAALRGPRHLVVKFERLEQ